FHPAFASNGRVYLHDTAHGALRDIRSRIDDEFLDDVVGTCIRVVQVDTSVRCKRRMERHPQQTVLVAHQDVGTDVDVRALLGLVQHDDTPTLLDHEYAMIPRRGHDLQGHREVL